MPIFSGERICKKCDNEFEWKYLSAEHLGRSRFLTVMPITPNVCYASRVSDNIEDDIHSILLTCTHCGTKEVVRLNLSDQSILDDSDDEV